MKTKHLLIIMLIIFSLSMISAAKFPLVHKINQGYKSLSMHVDSDYIYTTSFIIKNPIPSQYVLIYNKRDYIINRKNRNKNRKLH